MRPDYRMPLVRSAHQLSADLHLSGILYQIHGITFKLDFSLAEAPWRITKMPNSGHRIENGMSSSSSASQGGLRVA